jgi:hypothetical protein
MSEAELRHKRRDKIAVALGRTGKKYGEYGAAKLDVAHRA